MSKRSFILFFELTRCRIAAVSDQQITWQTVSWPAAPSADEIAEHLHAALQQAGYRGQSVALLIPSQWCIAASISLSDLPRQDRRAMSFRFEEQIPLALEEVVVDFTVVADRALGICVKVDSLRPLVESLEARGIAVDSIAPAAICAAQALSSGGSSHLLLIGQDEIVNVLLVQNNRAVAWSVAPANVDNVKLHVDMMLRRAGVMELRGCDVAPQIVQSLGQVNALPGSAPDAAARAARRVLLGRAAPWCELRRDQLAARDRWRAYRRAVNALLTAAAVLLLAIASVMLIRAGRYNAAAATAERDMRQMFQTEFPGWAIPVNVAAMVQSEHRKLAAARAGAVRKGSAESALWVLARVLRSIPVDSQISLDRMTFDDRGFLLEGFVAVAVQLDELVNSVRAAGMRVTPPTVQRAAEGAWRFTLQGEVSSSASGASPVAEVNR